MSSAVTPQQRAPRKGNDASPSPSSPDSADGTDSTPPAVSPDPIGPVEPPSAATQPGDPVPDPGTAKKDPGSTPVGVAAPEAASHGPRGPAKRHPQPESFDDLARKVAQAEPRRGSMLQPPPAWQPDEVTLGFAMVTDQAGGVSELPEPTLLATILVAVENDRRGLLHRLASRAEEEIEAIANVYWPLVVLPGRTAPQVAIFDGTGVWKRSFRYTLLPQVDEVPKLLDGDLPPTEYLARIHNILPQLAQDPGAEVLTVEGFLPVDPPLLFDILTHSDFRSDPKSPHAGFLPARHDLIWYNETVDQMYRWLERFDADLEKLGSVRRQTQVILEGAERRLAEESRRIEVERQQRVAQATSQAEAEVVRVQSAHGAQVQLHLRRIREAQAAIAHGETSASTADTLAFRATHRRAEGEAHSLRRKQAEKLVRDANRAGAESRNEIEKIHARERADLEQAVSQVTEVERRFARTLADHELFRDEFAAAGADLLHAIDGQTAARSAQKNLLAGYFLPVASLSGTRVVWFPLWVATLRGPGSTRQIVFPPMRVLSEKRLGGTLRQLFGGVVLPVEPRTAHFDQVLRTTMEDALRKDPWLSSATLELTRAADVLVDPDVLERLQIGLATLQREGWITRRQEESFLAAYVERAKRKARASLSGSPPVVPGTAAAPPPTEEAPGRVSTEAQRQLPGTDPPSNGAAHP